MTDGGALPHHPRVPELLAPAGDWDALRAAVANGADAVYFGLEAFNARRRATNFTRDELPRVIDYLHDRNVKAYVAFNTLIFSDELSQAVEFATSIATSGADAAIVQDIGLLAVLRRLAPTLPVHASTQMTQTEPAGIERLRSLGVSRVIVARELTLAELAAVARATRVELEVFVHGALCISASGQCLASEALFGRSANRGQCAQACRLPYRLIADGRPLDLRDREYLLSAQDLAAYDRIGALMDLGIAAFKIEGRLKSAHYVAAATRVYRKAIDAALDGRPFAPSREEEEDLVQSFSRGTAGGFLGGVDHHALVHGRFPKHRGVHLGTVASTTRQGVTVELEPAHREAARPLPVKPGDGVVFDEGRPERDEQGGRVFAVELAPGTARRQGPPARIELRFGFGDVNLAAIAPGAHVWKTDDPAIRRRIEQSFNRDIVPRRAPLSVRVFASPGEPLALTVADREGHAVQVLSEEPLTAAARHPLTAALVRDQFGRLGGTPFSLEEVELSGPEGEADVRPVMVPKSVLNALRRRAVENLLEQRRSGARHAIAEPEALDLLRGSARTAAASLDARPRLHVLVRTLEQLESALDWSPPRGIERGNVYADFQTEAEFVTARVVAGRGRLSIALPRLLMPGDEPVVARMIESETPAALVRTLGSISIARARATGCSLIADRSLNAVNEVSLRVLAEAGLERATPGFDLDAARLAALARLGDTSRLEIVIHGPTPLFHTRYCLFAAHLGGSPSCTGCARPCLDHEVALRDRTGAEHPVVADVAGRNTIFGASVPSMATNELGQLLDAGIRHLRIELLRESAIQTREILDRTCALVLRCRE